MFCFFSREELVCFCVFFGFRILILFMFDLIYLIYKIIIFYGDIVDFRG